LTYEGEEFLLEAGRTHSGRRAELSECMSGDLEKENGTGANKETDFTVEAIPPLSNWEWARAKVSKKQLRHVLSLYWEEGSGSISRKDAPPKSREKW